MTTYRIRIGENYGSLVTGFLWKDIQAHSMEEAKAAADAIVAANADLDLFVRFVVELDKAGA
jgi:hypothetical protein